jgi:hypothetical protein
MRRWKKVLILVSAIAVVVIACIISWTYGLIQGISMSERTNSMSELMLAKEHMVEQMANASCEGVKQAINDYLKVIERYKDVKDGVTRETIYFGDIMLGHIRLARLEGHLGNSAEKSRHIAIAKEACIHRKVIDCSEENIIRIAKRLEEKNPIACLTNEK